VEKDKYHRNVELICPTCGGKLFEFKEGDKEFIELFKCASCGRKISKDELIRENEENINENLTEIGQEVMKDFKKEFKKTLKETFKNDKNIRVE
jgi:uncharacterized Zn finger protein (UPF0148 family)